MGLSSSKIKVFYYYQNLVSASKDRIGAAGFDLL